MSANANKIKVLVTREIPGPGIGMLKAEGFDVSVWPHDRPMLPGELVEAAKNANAVLSLLTDSINAVFLTECGHLDVISQFSVGYDNIDVAEATRLGILVGYAPGAMSDATADVAFGLMIAVSRKMFYMHKSIANGGWTYFKPQENLGIELKNKTLGIFGLGRIGLQMALRSRGAYNMSVIYHNRKPNAELAERIDARFVSYDELLSQSDVLSVHCTLTEETRGIFDSRAFEKMKTGSIFINTARGAIHNEADLLTALETQQIWGAGLDVTNPEPMSANNPLLSMPNVAILPHIGSATVEARGEMSKLAALNIIEFYRGNRMPNIINSGTMGKQDRVLRK